MAEEPRWSRADAWRERYRQAAGEAVQHDVRSYVAALDAIASVDVAGMAMADLTKRASHLKERAGGEPLASLLPEVFAVSRALAPFTVGMRPFDVQMAAGVALARGRLVQLATGEGKTLAAVPPAILHALTGRGVHIFTANDYLAERDAAWMAPLYRAFGLDCAAVTEGLSRRGAAAGLRSPTSPMSPRARRASTICATTPRSTPLTSSIAAITSRLSTRPTASWSTRRACRW